MNHEGLAADTKRTKRALVRRGLAWGGPCQVRRATLTGLAPQWIAAPLIVLLTVGGVPLLAQQSAATPVFRSSTQIVSVDVIVRDGSGAIVRGLTAADFAVTEDGKPQQVQTFTFQEITDRPSGATETTTLLAGAEDRLRQEVERSAGASAATPAAAVSPDAFAGRRLLVLLFDISSMQPEDVQRAVDSAQAYVKDKMSASDLVAVVTIGSTLDVLSDFSNDKELVQTALQRLSYADGTATPPVAASTVATDEADASSDAATTDDTGFDSFNNDVRLRALKTLAETLGPIEQKKAILYFSAGMERSGEDNQVELRSAINAAIRGNVAIYPVDSRGLQAVVPGGDATRASGRGVSLFSGQGVQRQFSSLQAQQDTLVTLASDTGGRAFTDSNDFGEAFARAQRDLSAYYLIGYSSTNATKDGRYRKIQVRVVTRKGLRVEARAGYYAERDFSHTTSRDRETQLDDELNSAVSSTDLPVVVGAGWFRQAADRFYVPIALAVPGSSVPVAANASNATLDVRGIVRDEQGRIVGRIKDTLTLPSSGATTLAGKQILYQSGVALPAGRFSVKVVVRENASGTIGSFEAPILVPQLRDAAMKVSSVVFSTQLQPASGKASTGNPLIRDGMQLLPNLTRVIARDQSAYFYFELYDPALADMTPQVRTSLAFYRGNTKVFETPVVERAAIDDPVRKAVVFQFQVPATALPPGAYTCQVNVIDAVAGRVAFPRLTFAVR